MDLFKGALVALFCSAKKNLDSKFNEGELKFVVSGF
jgi:hypothetical protein